MQSGSTSPDILMPDDAPQNLLVDAIIFGYVWWLSNDRRSMILMNPIHFSSFPIISLNIDILCKYIPTESKPPVFTILKVYHHFSSFLVVLAERFGGAMRSTGDRSQSGDMAQKSCKSHEFSVEVHMKS